jgi:hypothetical protein
MNTQHESLTPGEQRFLERQQEADSEGISLPEYYRSHGLSVHALYSVRKQLVSKGVLPRGPGGRPARTPASPGRFVAVRVAAPTLATTPGKSCRLRSPSGWVIEFDGVPELSWVSALMGVQS